MTTVFTDNFDSYVTNLGAPWTGIGDSPVSTLRFVSSPQSLTMGAGGSGSVALRAMGSNLVDGYFDFQLWLVGSSLGLVNSVIFWDSTAVAEQITLKWQYDGLCSVYRGSSGGTLLGTFALCPDQWHEITVYAKIDATVGIVQVAVDQNLVFNFSGNTKSTANTYFNSVKLSGGVIGTTPAAFAYLDNFTAGSGVPPGLAGSTPSTTLWSDNFDTYTTNASNPPWGGGSVQLSTVTFFSSPNALQLGNGGNASTGWRAIGPLVTGTVAFEFNQSSASSGACKMSFFDIVGVIQQITIQFGLSGTATVFRGGTGGTSLGTFAFTNNTWHLVSATVLIDSVSGTVAISVDGSSVFTFSGNTKAGGGTYYSGVEFNGITIGPSPPAEAFTDNVVASGTFPTLSNSLWVGGLAGGAGQNFLACGMI